MTDHAHGGEDGSAGVRSPLSAFSRPHRASHADDSRTPGAHATRGADHCASRRQAVRLAVPSLLAKPSGAHPQPDMAASWGARANYQARPDRLFQRSPVQHFWGWHSRETQRFRSIDCRGSAIRSSTHCIAPTSRMSRAWSGSLRPIPRHLATSSASTGPRSKSWAQTPGRFSPLRRVVASHGNVTSVTVTAP